MLLHYSSLQLHPEGVIAIENGMIITTLASPTLGPRVAPVGKFIECIYSVRPDFANNALNVQTGPPES